MRNIHQHYEQLTTGEKIFVDDVFTDVFKKADAWGVPLYGTDIIERAVDALAKSVIESRFNEVKP